MGNIVEKQKGGKMAHARAKNNEKLQKGLFKKDKSPTVYGGKFRMVECRLHFGMSMCFWFIDVIAFLLWGSCSWLS